MLMKYPHLALLLLLLGCQGEPEELATAPPTPRETLQQVQLGTLERLHTRDGVYLSGQPTADDLALLQQRGVVTVIDQRGDAETPDLDERAVVTELGLAYHNPAFGGPLPLTDEVLDQTRELLRDAPRPLLMHCASANRTGAAWLAYLLVDEGLPVDLALAEAKQVGLRSPAYEQQVLDYADRRTSR